jgi:hypothetical protein
MNAREPAGRPVYVFFRNSISSSPILSDSKYAAHCSGVKAELIGSGCNHSGGETTPVWAAALDHGNSLA